MTGEWFLAGQMLAEDEIAATGALSMSLCKQRALKLCLDADRLDFSRRLGWQHPRGSQRVQNGTIEALARQGLLVIVSKSQFRKHARLTTTGNWYARTIVTDLMARVRAIVAEER